MTLVFALPAPVRQVAAGYGHTGIVTEAGDLLMCGEGGDGRLGLGDEEDRATPTRVARALFDGEAVLMVACGTFHTVVVTEGGGVYTFGDGKDGRLGHGDYQDQLAPKRVPAAEFNGERVVMVAAACAHTVALSEAGHVFTWGFGLSGQLGHHDEEHQRAPRQVEAGWFGGEKVVFVAAGGLHTVAVTAGGRLYTWGYNWKGQLGNGENRNRKVPTLVGGFGAPEGGRVVMAACGSTHTLVVTQDGALWACGAGGSGQLGLNDVADRFDFERVGAGAFGSARVVAAAAGDRHSAAVTEDGALWTWGYGSDGQLGHGNKEKKSVPEKISKEMFKSLCSQVPPAHMLAFVMSAQNRLGETSPARIIGGEQGLLSMIAQFTHKLLPPAVNKSEGLMRLLGQLNQPYHVTVTPTLVIS